MANFFTRLTERSLGVSPVVRPAIAPRYSSAPAMPNEVEGAPLAEPEGTFLETETFDRHNSSWGIADSGDEVTAQGLEKPFRVPQNHTAIQQRPFWDDTANQPPFVAPPKPSTHQPYSQPQSLQSPGPVSEPNLVLEAVHEQTPSSTHVDPSLMGQPSQPFVDQPENDIAASHSSLGLTNSSRDKGNQSTPPEPFRVLPPDQQIAIESQPVIVIASPKSKLATPASIANSAPLTQKSTPSQATQQQSEHDALTERIVDQRNPKYLPVPSVQSGLQQDLQTIGPASRFSPVPADREPLPPTIRVSIGRVEVRAIMPTPPAPKAVPTRPRPAVSLNDYLKQRGGKP